MNELIFTKNGERIATGSVFEIDIKESDVWKDRMKESLEWSMIYYPPKKRTGEFIYYFRRKNRYFFRTLHGEKLDVVLSEEDCKEFAELKYYDKVTIEFEIA